MRVQHIATFFLYCCALVCSAMGTPPAENHPILGSWVFHVPDSECVEVYFYRSNGTTLTTSAEEVSESEYTISDEPGPGGFYKYVDTVVKDNGKKDCSGSITKAGEKTTYFIRFFQENEVFVMCKDESLDACFGPFIRNHGQEA